MTNNPEVSPAMTAEEKVKVVYPEAQIVWTSRGWRVLVVDIPGNDVHEVGRTSSGHVPESEAWIDAASRLPASPVADTDNAMTHKQLADSFNSLFQPAPPEAEMTGEHNFFASPVAEGESHDA